MSAQTTITSAELAVMQVLWEADTSLKIQEVWERLPDAGWKYNTVGTLLLRLEEKGAVRCEKTQKTVSTPPCWIKKNTRKARRRVSSTASTTVLPENWQLHWYVRKV